MAKLGASVDGVLTVHSSPPESLLPLLRTDELETLFIRNYVPVFLSFSCFFFN